MSEKIKKIETQVQEFRDYMTTILSLFIFSAGIGLRSINDNFAPYLLTVFFTLLLYSYIFARYGFKGINQKRKTASIEGIVTKEVYEKIQEIKAEIYIVEKIELIDYFRIFILSISFIFLFTSYT